MRPSILNPIFAEVEALKGVGPNIAKPLRKLEITRVVDALFHLPTGTVVRRAVDALRTSDAGSNVIVALTPVEYRSGRSVRAPFRVDARDGEGNIVSLVYFGRNGGWAKKLFPLGEERIVSGKLEAYGDSLQIIHPDYVLEAGEGAALPLSEGVYPLSEGLTSRRMAQLASQALERAPRLPEWIEPSLLAQQGWPGWNDAIVRAHHAAGTQRGTQPRGGCGQKLPSVFHEPLL